jgi:hypothetical protein
MRTTLAIVIAALVAFAAGVANAKPKNTIRIIQPDERYLGKTYPEWAAVFWQWMLGLPLEGHPVVDDGLFDFSAGQSGKVWFWASPEGTITRTVTLPEGRAFLLSLRDVDTSSLEGAALLRRQLRTTAVQLCLVCGSHCGRILHRRRCPRRFDPLSLLNSAIRIYCADSFYFGATGGTGTAVGDGYFLIFPDLPRGRHTIHYGGTFHFEPGELGDEAMDFTKDTTIEMTVGK